MKSKIIAALLGGACLALSGCSTQTSSTTQVTPSVEPKPAKPKETAKAAADEPKVILPPAPGISQRPAVREFIAEMSQKHGFSPAELTRAFDEAGIVPAIHAIGDRANHAVLNTARQNRSWRQLDASR